MRLRERQDLMVAAEGGAPAPKNNEPSCPITKTHETQTKVGIGDGERTVLMII